MMKELKISNSELRTFKACRRRWYLTYFRELGLPEEDRAPTGALQLGGRVHDALKAMYEDKMNGLVRLQQIYEEAKKKWADDPEALLELAKEYDLAAAMIEGYIEWLSDTGADSGYEIVEVEQALEVPFGQWPEHGFTVTLRGKLDARVTRKSDGARLFIDHKTVGNFAEPAKILHLDEQMRFYHLLEMLDALLRTGDAPPKPTDGGIYNMLRKVKRTARAKPPFYDRLEARHNTTEIQNMWYRVLGEVEDIMRVRNELDRGENHQRVVYPNPGRECTYMCPFLAVCPLMDDGSDSERMLANEYIHVDPHERYAEFEKASAE